MFSACSSGPTDAQRVHAGVERIRLLEPSDVAGRRDATEKLANLEVGDAARPARDACAAAYRASTELFGVIVELENILRSGEAKAREDEARGLFLRSGELQKTSEEELTRCNVELSKL